MEKPPALHHIVKEWCPGSGVRIMICCFPILYALMAVEVMVEMQTMSELSMNDQSGGVRSSINVFTVYPLSLRIVESNTAPSRGMGNLLKMCRPGVPASINEIFLMLTVFVSLLYIHNVMGAQ